MTTTEKLDCHADGDEGEGLIGHKWRQAGIYFMPGVLRMLLGVEYYTMA